MARKIQGRYNKRQQNQDELGLQDTCTALYVRVSTQSQAEEGYSLEAQQERLQAYCTAQGWHVCTDHIYVDAGVSGKTIDRPQFQAMLQAAQEGKIQRIVAMKLDRLARNVREFLATVDQLKAWHCDLVLVKESFDTSTPHGRFALTMFAAMAELEASTITERVMSGKTQKASKGGYNGSPIPYGYTYAGGIFAVNNSQAGIVRDIFKRFVACQPLYSIATDLNAAGIPSPTGKQWSHVGIKHILSNGMYAGVTQWAGIEAKGEQPAIIDQAHYEAAAAKLATLTRGNPDFRKAE
jgi:site-specific DNA recombinase